MRAEPPSVDARFKPECRGILVVLASDVSAVGLFEQAASLAQSNAVPLFVVRAAPAPSLGLRARRPESRPTARAELFPCVRERPIEQEILTDERALASVVSDAALRWQPSLILVSADHRPNSALAIALANTTLIPVLVWRATGDTRAIVVATALRDPTYPVLRCASDLAAWLHASIVAFHNVNDAVRRLHRGGTRAAQAQSPVGLRAQVLENSRLQRRHVSPLHGQRHRGSGL
jgi:hypothetical protein